MNIAFIPVRGGSKSIQLKNIKLINNRPLIYWTLDAASNCKLIDKIVISTDSEKIKECVENYNCNKIEIFNRSKETATDTASTESAMLEYAEKNTFDNMILIQATSPLIESKYLEKGINEFNKPQVDSVLSVVRQKRFVWESLNGKCISKNYDYMNRPRRQDFEGFLVENGAFYITKRDDLLKTRCRLSGNISYIEMPEETYFEIDEISDWIIIENLLKQKSNESDADFSKVKLLLTDSDGVLTDGGMYYSENGDELKKFNTKDGMGFELLRKKGIITGIITGENKELVKKRAEKLKIDELHMGIKNKLLTVRLICEKYKISLENVAYIGDDINDLDVIRNVGIGCSVNDAMECIKSESNYVTKVNGGEGAVREIAELILKNRK
ncbi:cytidylyltransferase domain-containing protein [Clostridium neonatale]|uniref:cytidylyltransferase domain-containing protein n=1 Tax=Clostridium neonatale TaxID=137838 RepID=UPI003D33D5FF